MTVRVPPAWYCAVFGLQLLGEVHADHDDSDSANDQTDYHYDHRPEMSGENRSKRASLVSDAPHHIDDGKYERSSPECQSDNDENDPSGHATSEKVLDKVLYVH